MCMKFSCLEPAANADWHNCNAVIYLVDVSEVPDFSTMYELYDPCTVMFFFRNKVSSCCAGHGLLSLSGDPPASASLCMHDALMCSSQLLTPH